MKVWEGACKMVIMWGVAYLYIFHNIKLYYLIMSMPVSIRSLIAECRDASQAELIDPSGVRMLPFEKGFSLGSQILHGFLILKIIQIPPPTKFGSPPYLCTMLFWLRR